MFFAKTETSEVSETSEVCNQYPLFARRAKCVLAEVQEHWDDILTSELMDTYLIGSYEWKDGRPTRIGYFVGAQIVNSVLTKGHEIGTLTKMPTEKIMELS